MKKIADWPIQKKLFAGMLLFSVLIVFIVTATAIKNTYDTMKEQLIYNRRMSVGWLRDRLELELSNFQNHFYEFEVDMKRKELIKSWCMEKNELDYVEQWNLITAMNEIVSMDKNLNSMEIINLESGKTLTAERSGASMREAGEVLEIWSGRAGGLQNNLVFYRTGKEILIFHQMHRFEDKTPYALIVMHLRPYDLQDILSDIKMTADESIFVFNDENQWIEADCGEGEELCIEDAGTAAVSFTELQKQEFMWEGNFWFYREVSGGKLKVLLSVPNHVIVESLTGTVLMAALVGGVMLVVCAAASSLLARIFAGPIIKLSDTMRNFTLQDSEESIREEKYNGTSRNEIAVLQDSFAVMVKRNKTLIAQEYQMKLEKQEAQIHALQAQINPHFMYNVMQVIGGMALQRQAPEIYRVTGALGDLMRYCLNFSREMVPLKEEIHYLQSYCMLQNERFNDRIKLQVKIEEELLGCLVPKLLLQPVLENSFHHGLVNKAGDWLLEVKGTLEEEQEGNTLVLKVMDNGNGIPSWRLKEIQDNLNEDANAALKAGGHIGLCNVDARIRLRYPEGNYGLSIDSTEGKGTTVTLKMKAVEKEKKHETTV